MKAKKRIAVVIISLAAAAVAAWFGWFQFGPGSTSGSEPRLHYGGISISRPPEESGLAATADYAPPESSEKPGGGPVIVVSSLEQTRSPPEYLVIDATTGEVLVDEIGSDHRAAADDVIDSMRQEDSPAPVWPIADVAPTGSRMVHGTISYTQPDPSSGIFALPQEVDWVGGNGVALFVHNGKSRMLVDGTTGTIDKSRVVGADREAFDRFAETVTVARQDETVPH